VKNIRPRQSEPLAGGDHQPELATILMRFVVLLVVAIAILAITWRT
jgi:hypothetical protein